jgi:8-amino-7-oxononanoate synthase
MNEIEERLAELERMGLDRRLRMVSGPQGPTVLLDGRPVLLLCSNNYLGLADHPRVREASAEAAMRWGVGAGASRLVSGTMTIHRRLEERLAAFEHSEACMLFGSGYLANIGVIGALAGGGDTVFSDELNHASIIDGCRLSRAETVVYRHADVEHLDWSLRRHGRGRPLIVTDSVFSMDGDVAPLAEIVELAGAHGARTVVDEAHATGALGPEGRGAIAQAGLDGEVDVIVGTLGKALGSYGAYVCTDAETVRYLVNTARSLIFSTAPPPPAVAGALAALELLWERPHRVQRLRSNARALRRSLAEEGFPVAEDGLHIVPLVVGEEHAAMRLCQGAIERGVFAQAIRPPTVQAGTSRLRLATMASHTASELRIAARTLGEVARGMGLDPAEIGPPRAQRHVPDLEPFAPELEPSAHVEPFIPEFDEPGIATAELDAGRERLAAAVRSRSRAPFDAERVTVDGVTEDAQIAASAGAGGPSGPFDIERETAVPRAA